MPGGAGALSDLVHGVDDRSPSRRRHRRASRRRRTGRGRRRARGSSPIGSRPATSGRTFGLRRRRCASDLRPDVEPGGPAAAEQAPAVARVDDRAAARRDDPRQPWPGVRLAERLDRRPLAPPEAGLALGLEDLRDPRSRPRARSARRGRRRSRRGATPPAARSRSCRCPGSPTTTSSIASRRRRTPTAGASSAARRIAPAPPPAPSVDRRGQALAPAGHRLPDLGHRVAAGLLEHEPRQREHDHRLADDARRRHDADVAALVVGLLDRRAGQQVGGGQRDGRGSRSA